MESEEERIRVRIEADRRVPVVFFRKAGFNNQEAFDLSHQTHTDDGRQQVLEMLDSATPNF